MKDFTEDSFLKLSPERQMKLTLDLIHHIEKVWSFEPKRRSSIEQLKTHLIWMSKNKEFSQLRPKALKSSLEGDPSLRKVLNIAMAFERRLSISLKDEAILVNKTDSEKSKNSLSPLYLVLDNLRSAHNVGSVFRTADCLGVKHIYLVGYTATPEDKAVKKTAMGTDEFVSWSHFEKLDDLIAELKKKNIKLAALETVQGAVPIFEARMEPGLALVLGNERFGLETKFLEKMDYILEIPMKGRKNSLNVSNACAIATFEILKSWK